MQLPAWVKSMRRRPKDIKIKDFVDDKTKREIVKRFGSEPRKAQTATADLLAYMSEARTVQEVQARFGYASLSSAYKALHNQEKKGEVAVLGHGLYVATNAGLVSYKLSDKELSERGLDALRRNVSQSPGTRAQRGRTITIKNIVERANAIVAFCDVPRSTEDIATEFGYSHRSHTNPLLRRLVKKGRLFEYTGHRHNKLFINVPPAEHETHTKTLPAVPALPSTSETLPKDEAVEVEPIIQYRDIATESIEELAKQYLWERDDSLYDTGVKEVLKAFVTWANAREDQL